MFFFGGISNVIVLFLYDIDKSYVLVSDCRLDAAVLDLVADDGQGMKQQKTNYHWDKVINS